jgi:hypothetical protein
MNSWQQRLLHTLECQQLLAAMAAQLQRAAQVQREALEAEQRAHSKAQATSAELQSTQAQLVKDSMLGMEVLARAMRQLEAEQAAHAATRAALSEEQEAHTACRQALAEVEANLEDCEAELDAEQRAHDDTMGELDKEQDQSQHAETREKLEQLANLLRAALRQRQAEATRAASAIS